MLVHFASLKADMEGEIRKIARFLQIDNAGLDWSTILEHCCFDYMKAHAALSAPLGGAFWEGGAQTFLHKGTNGRWRDVLTADDNMRYEELARDKLGEACASWLATGHMTT